jgi:hypothetical protein
MRYVLLLVLSLLLLSADATAETRVALVVGNSAYKGPGALTNPVNDARAMSNVLRQTGFDVVAVENGTKQQMERAVAAFSRKLGPDTISLFYFAGHGIQVAGRNYLLPVDVEITSEQTVRLASLDVDAVIEQMTMARSRVNMVILDACRNNPFERRFRSTAGGLASIDAPAGTLIAYATAPGKVAADGDGGNGLYTGELVRQLALPGQPVEAVFKQTRINVLQRSNGQQTPWESSSLTGEFYFSGGTTSVAALNPPPAPTPAKPVAAPVPRVSPGSPAGRDWLVGRWEGEVKGLRSKRGDERILTVTRVESDGKVIGGWASRQAAGIGSRADIRVEGDTVRVLITDEKNEVLLQRVAPDRLEGKFTASGGSGRTYNVVMERR